jgi:hypothetical protein
MTGYESKRAAAQDKLKLWDTPSEEFNDWWGNGYRSDTNPFSIDSLVYWAWAGWQAALAQPAQERNFCERCGKRTQDIHTCTPPQEKNGA